MTVFLDLDVNEPAIHIKCDGYDRRNEQTRSYS